MISTAAPPDRRRDGEHDDATTIPAHPGAVRAPSSPACGPPIASTISARTYSETPKKMMSTRWWLGPYQDGYSKARVSRPLSSIKPQFRAMNARSCALSFLLTSNLRLF